MRSLGEIAKVFRGVTYSVNEISNVRQDGYIAVLRAGNIQDYLHIDSDLIFVQESKVKRNQIIVKDDIVMCASSGSSDLVGKSAIAKEDTDVTFGGFCLLIRANNHISCPSYINHYFRSNIFRSWAKQAQGINIKNIRKNELEDLAIPLPPLEEQRRIAAILDKADAIRRKRQEALKLADDFLNGVFLDMFGDPVTNPKGWTVEPLYNVIDEVQGGWSVGGENRVKKADEKGVLKISAVTSGKYLPQEHKAVARDDCKRVLLTPKMGDLLFTRANTRELVAATCIVDFEDEDLFLPDKIWNIIPYTHKATKIFLKALFSHPKMRSRITRQSTGTSGSMLNISKTKLLSTEFPIPDFSMQEKFSNIYISSMNAMKKYSLLYNEAVNMANSLSSSFFKEH